MACGTGSPVVTTVTPVANVPNARRRDFWSERMESGTFTLTSWLTVLAHCPGSLALLTVLTHWRDPRPGRVP
ncbi:hypothetical protein Mth01_00740 [Sphaerimonospora thailandensis]|uniref:Uncharacterized protein n=1 Tax=Sphaerimonospora thailandensis TaxID=795644 RepID=A0A8J3R4T1_9ACTN|nr:hypothetical protein Mth01_00740 [Sphaerimonospora thailandensis]